MRFACRTFFCLFFLRGRLPVQCRCLRFASTVFAAFACQYSVGRFFSCLFSPFFFFFSLLGAGPGLCSLSAPSLHEGRRTPASSPRPGACICLLSSCSSLPGSALSLSLSIFLRCFFFLSLPCFSLLDSALQYEHELWKHGLSLLQVERGSARDVRKITSRIIGLWQPRFHNKVVV